MTTKAQAAIARKLLSLDDLDAEAKGGVPSRVPFLLDDGRETGVVFLVLGEESEKVKSGSAKLVNQRRKLELSRAAAGETTPISVEEDMEFAIKAASLRLAGWEGLAEEATPANCERLCRTNAKARAQIMTASGQDSRFLQISPAA